MLRTITTRSIDKLLASKSGLRMLKLMAMVMVVMMKRSKNHLFSKSQTYLQSILLPYTLEKDEFFLIVLAMVEALSLRQYLNDYKQSLQV